MTLFLISGFFKFVRTEVSPLSMRSILFSHCSYLACNITHLHTYTLWNSVLYSGLCAAVTCITSQLDHENVFDQVGPIANGWEHIPRSQHVGLCT
ncbi:hypothetical protein C8J55DRAFT_49394 [Lentinula edodes]|uniref:Uncharacterized protein n=1 Tax=Lentinula lateritia TaxID=40482 RepID=A0A9W9AHQ5_9AGAR|nr:hypothetical protein C8J55DRAFT_49394 [Lentinula edodes]